MKVLKYNEFVNESIIDDMSYPQRLFSVISSAMYEAEDGIKLHPEKYIDAESVLREIKQRAITRYDVTMSGLDNAPAKDEFWKCFSNLIHRIFNGDGEF